MFMFEIDANFQSFSTKNYVFEGYPDGEDVIHFRPAEREYITYPQGTGQAKHFTLSVTFHVHDDLQIRHSTWLQWDLHVMSLGMVNTSGDWTRSRVHHGSSHWPITSPYSFTSVFRKDLHTNNCFVVFTVLPTVWSDFF